MDADTLAWRLLATDEGRRDPVPLYEALRQLAPVHRTAQGSWVVSGYAAVAQVLRDRRFVHELTDSPRLRGIANPAAHPSLVATARGLLFLPEAEHARQRRIASPAFLRRRLGAHEPGFQALARELVGSFVAAGGGDVVASVATPYPARVMGRLLGLPDAEVPRFRQLVLHGSQVLELHLTEELLTELDRSFEAQLSLLRSVVAARRAQPGDDLVSELLLAEDAGERLTDDDVVYLSRLLFAAGVETTSSALAAAVALLVEQPELQARARLDPALVPLLVEESLRLHAPVQLTARMATEPVELAGQPIPAGARLLLLIGAANRDPSVFATPDRVSEPPHGGDHLAFGAGPHYCLGHALARMEIAAVVKSLLEQTSTIEADGAPVIRPRLTLRGHERLPVRCLPRA